MTKPSKDKPKVNLTGFTAYDASNERTIEFRHANGGGLITFKAMPDGTLRVRVHHQDAGVRVETQNVSEPTVRKIGAVT